MRGEDVAKANEKCSMGNNPRGDARFYDLISRRDFLGSMGAMSAAVAATIVLMNIPLLGCEPATAVFVEDVLDMDEPFFAAFAKTLLLENQDRYFAAGQKGSQPLPIIEEYKEGLNQIARDPFPVYLEPSEQTRAKIARSYGARVDEIAISRNTTDAVSQVINGLVWAPGDEILCSTMEYPTCVAVVLRAAARFGLTIRQFGVPMHPETTAEEIVESVRRQIRPGKTRVIFFSCPTNPNGTRLPAPRIAKLAQEYGITTVVDGAHYGGMLVPRLDDTGIDFWAISGHKWQCGPGGTGILYLRNAEHPANETPLPRFIPVRSGDLEGPMDGSRPADFDLGAAMSLYGFPESADWRALGQVCELWDVMGRERIETYIIALSKYLRGKITSIFGDEALLQPSKDPELLSGIIAFNPFPMKEQRRDPVLMNSFREALFRETGYRMGFGGLGATGLTRWPDLEASTFYDHCIPNRNPVSGEPEPSDLLFRVDTCLWNRREHFDLFLEACATQLDKMI